MPITPENTNNLESLDITAANGEMQQNVTSKVSEGECERESNNNIQSKTHQQSREYERAIRRALLENDYVKKVNSQLITKLNTMSQENEASRESVQKMKGVCESMKELITELAAAKDMSDGKVQEMERTYRQVADAEDARMAKLEALEIGQRAMDGMVAGLRDSMEAARRERDEAREEVSTLLAAKEALAKVVAERDVSTYEKKYLEGVQVAALTKERDDWKEKFNQSAKEMGKVGLKVKYGEMQVLLNEKEELVGTVAAVSKKSEDWEAKYSKSTKELKQIMSERDGLKAKCSEMQTLSREKEELEETVGMLAYDSDDWQAKFIKSTKQIDEVTSERDGLKARVDELSKFKECALAEKEVVKKSNSKLTLQMIVEKEELSNKVELLADAREKSEQRSEGLLGELESVRASLVNTKTTSDELLAAKDSLQQEVKTLQCTVTEMTAAKATAFESLHKELEISTAKRDELSVKKDSMQKEIFDITKKRDELSASDESMQLQIKSLLIEVSRVTSAKATEVENLQKELKSVQKSLSDTSTKLDEFSASNDAKQQEIESLQANVNELTVTKEAEIENLQLELGKVQTSLNDAINMRDELAATKTVMQLEIDALQRNLSEVTDSKEAQIGNLRKEFETMQTSLNDTLTMRDELSSANMLVVAEISAAKEAEAENLRNELKIVQASLDDASTRRDVLSEQIETAQGELSRLTDAKEAEIGNLQHELALVQKQLDDSEGNTNRLNIDLESHQSRLKVANDSIEALQTEKKTLSEDMTLKLDDMIKQKEILSEQLQSKITSLEADLLQSKQEEERLISAMKLLESSHAETLSHLENEKNDLLNQKQEIIDSLSADVEGANERSSSLSAELNDAKKAAGQFSSNISSLGTHLLESRQESVRLGNEKNDLVQRIESLSAEIEIVNDKSYSLSTKLVDAKNVASQEQESLEADLLESKQEEERLVNATKALESGHAEALARVDGEKNAYIQELEKKMDNIVEKSLGAMEEQLKRALAEKEAKAKEADTLSVALARAQYQCSALTKQLEECKLAHDEEREAISLKLSAKEKIEVELQTEQEKLKSSIATLSQERDELAVQLDGSKQKGDANSALIENLQSQQDASIQKLSELTSRVEFANTEKESLSKEKAELSAEKKSLQQQIVTLQTNVSQITAAKEEEIRNFQNESDSVRKQRDDAEGSAKRLVNDLEACQSRIKIAANSIDTLHEQLAEREKREVNLTSELEELSKQKDSLSEKITSLEADLLQSKQQEERLGSATKSSESSHAQALERLEVEKNGLINQKQQMAKRIDSFLTKVENANEERCSLDAELNDAKQMASQEHERLNTKITTLESDLLESKQCTSSKVAEVENLQKDLEAVQKSLLANTMMRDELSAEKDNKSKEIETLHTRVSQVVTATKEEVGKLQVELENVRNQLGDSEINAKRLTIDLEECHKRLEVADHALAGERDKLEENMALKLDEVTMQKENLADSMKTIMRELANMNDDRSPSTKLRAARAVTAAEKEDESQGTRSMQMIGKLKSNLRSLQSQKADLLKSIREKTAAIDDFESKKQDMSQRIEMISTEVEHANERNITLSTELDYAKKMASQEHERLNTKIISLEADLLQSKQEEERLGDVAKSFESSQTEALAQWEDEKKGFQDQFNALSETTAAEKKQFVERMHTLETSKELLVEKEKERCEKIQQLIQQVDDTESGLEQSKADSKSLLGKYNELENLNKDQRDQIVQLNTQVEDATYSVTDRENQHEILINKLSQLESEKDAAMTKIEGLSEELKSTAATLSEVQVLISADQEQAAEMRNEIKSLGESKLRLEESMLSVKRDREEIESKLEFSEQEAEDFRCKLNTSNLLAESMTNQCEQLTNDRDSVESKLEISLQRADVLRTNLESSEILVKSMTKTCDKLTRYIAELGTKHDAAEVLANDLRSENQRAIARCKLVQKTHQSEISCLENIITSLKKEYEAFKVEAIATKASQLRSCEAKLESLCATGENLTRRQQDRTFDDLIVILRKERSNLLKKTESTAKELKAAQDERSCLDARIEKERSNLLEKANLTAKELKAAQDERSCLENIVTSLKKEYEAFKVEARSTHVAQMRSYEAKLKPLCATGGNGILRQQDRSFDDMIAIIQNEQSNLSLMAEELEAAQDETVILEQQVRILSTEVSKYKLQNKGMLQALDEITNVKQGVGRDKGDIPMDEIAIDREVEKRLMSFRHKVEM